MLEDQQVDYEEQLEAGAALLGTQPKKASSAKLKRQGTKKELGLMNRQIEEKIKEQKQREAMERDFLKGLDFLQDVEIRLHFMGEYRWW